MLLLRRATASCLLPRFRYGMASNHNISSLAKRSEYYAIYYGPSQSLFMDPGLGKRDDEKSDGVNGGISW